MDKEYLIRQNPMRAMLVLAFPMIVGNLFQQFYNMVDSVIVGRYVGEDALAAVGASYALTYVFISIATGGGIGASVLTGRAFGRRDYDRMKRSISTALLSFLILSVLLGAFGLLASERIMTWLQTPDNIMEDAQTYLNIYFLGLPFLFMYNVLASMFNALGRSRIPLYLLIFSSVLNVILDIVMVRVFGLDDPENLIRVLSALVKPGGTLTVAHGMSRAAIDHRHAGPASKVSVGLMHEDALAGMFEKHLTVTTKLSTDRMYQVTGRK